MATVQNRVLGLVYLSPQQQQTWAVLWGIKTGDTVLVGITPDQKYAAAYAGTAYVQMVGEPILYCDTNGWIGVTYTIKNIGKIGVWARPTISKIMGSD